MRQDRPQRPPNESGRDQLDPQPPSLRRKEPSPAELQQHIQDPATPNIFNHFLNIEDVLHQKKCTHCGKKFNRKRDLRIHVRSCLGDIRHDESPEEHHPQNGPSRSDGFYGDNDMNGHNNVAINPPGEATTTEPAVSFDPQPRPSSGSHGSSPSSITDEFLATESLPENIIQIQQESSFHHVNQSLPVSDNSSESALPSFQSSQEVGNDVISSHVDPSIHDRSQSPPSVDDGVHETFTANDSSDSECWTETGRDFNVPINRSLEIQRPHNQETVSSQETVSTEGRESDWLGIPESETTDSAGNHDVLETDNNDRNGLDAQKEDESSPDFTINPFEEPHDFGMFSGNYDILLNPLGFHEQNRFIVEAETPLSHDVPPPSGRQIHTEARLYNPMLRGNQSTYYNLAQQRQGPQGFHPRQNEGAAFGYPNGPPSFFANNTQPLNRNATVSPGLFPLFYPHQQGFSSVSHNQGPSGPHVSPPEDADDDEITVLDHPTGVPSMTHSNSLQNRPPVIGPPPGFDKISATSDVHRSFVSHADNTAIFNNEATDIEAPSLGFNDGQQFWPPVVIPPPGFENIPASYDVHLHQDEKPSLQQGSVKEESSSPLKSAPHFVAVKDEDAERKLFSSGNDPSAEYSAAYAVSYDDDDAPIDVNLAFLARRSSSRTRSATKIYNPDYIPYMSRKRRATKRSPRQINDHDGDVKPTVFKRGRGRPPKIQDDDEVVDAKPFSKKSRSAATRRPRKRPASPSTVPLSPQKIFKTVASLKAEKKPELDEGDKLVAKYKKDQEQLTPEQLAEVQAAVMETGRCRPEHITLMDESALQEISKKLKTKAAKVTSTEDFCKDDLVWEVDSVIRVTMKREIAQDEKVFLVSWKGWGMAYCTLISLLDLQGAPDVLNEYYLFATGVEAVLANFRTFVGNHPASLTEFGAPKRLPLRRIDAIFRIYMSDQELLALFKKNKSLAKMFSLWIWKILEKRWKLELEKLYGEPRDVLRVECFFAEALSRAPINFTFITENVFSQAASEEAAALFKTPRGCKCNAHTGFCAVCRDLGLPHPECRLEGNKMVAVPRGDAKHKRSHCAVLCGEGSLCPPDAPCRKLPLRDNCLLVTFSPKIKGLGVFALSAIKKHTVLVEYTGEVMTMREANVKCRNYQFDVTGTNLSLDARVYGNESRFVNHSCEPNVGVVVVYTGSIGAYPRIYYATLRDIVMGEELFVDYHPDLVDHPNPAAALTKASECFCGTPSCRGVV